jgi:hypothetical protein
MLGHQGGGFFWSNGVRKKGKMETTIIFQFQKGILKGASGIKPIVGRNAKSTSS